MLAANYHPATKHGAPVRAELGVRTIFNILGLLVSLLKTLSSQGLAVSFVDATSVTDAEAALTTPTRIVFVETIANSRLQLADPARIGQLCAEHGILYVVDNTITSPWLFQPKSVRASLVVNALTKYIGGHGNALGGSITDTGAFDRTTYPKISGHENRTYPATAPQALSAAELAPILTDIAGPAHYVAIALDKAEAAMIAAGVPETLANAMNELYALAPARHIAGVLDKVAKVTRRPGPHFQAVCAGASAFFAKR